MMKRKYYIPVEIDRRKTVKPEFVQKLKLLRDCGWSLRRIGEHVGISHERVRVILKKVV